MDKTAALAVPGALAVLAGADYVADGLKPIPHNAGLVEPPDLVVRLCGMDPIAPRIGRYRSKRRVSSAKA